MSYITQAEYVSQIVPAVLQERNLTPEFNRFVLVEQGRAAWLFCCLDVNRIGRLENYASKDTVHHLSTALNGKPVVVSNHSGLRYAVLLSEPPKLPTDIAFPGWKAGELQLGVNTEGAVSIPWREMGHMLVGGMTGGGKSNFLRLMVQQAIQENYALALADPDGRTFARLDGHPALIAPLGEDLEGSVDVVERSLAEVIRRSALYKKANNYPDSIDAYNEGAAEKLKRLLVIVDEFNGLVMATGGPKGALANAATQIAWRGRKFGVHLVLAGQDFSAEVVGKVRDQMTSRVCFRVANAGISRIVIGRSGAESLKVVGRAWTNNYGMLQVYRESLEDVLQGAPRGDGLTEEERSLIEKLTAQGGERLTLEAFETVGVPRRSAERLRASWLSRGIVRRGDNNSFVLASSIA